jgi:2-amino-4-hydroxy-6-hydroxymethyldihydropteridine diphosphokinase
VSAPRRARPYEHLVAVGSNVRPEANVPAALDHLAARFEVVAVSPRYDVAAVGRAGLPAFVNLAVRLRSDLPPPALRVSLRRIEEACGRRRSADRFAPRPIDLDLVLSAPDVPCGEDLPHPDLLEQAHVLVPCADVWPDATVGAAGRTLGDEARHRFAGWADGHRRGEGP